MSDEYASKGVAGTALGFGIAGTALGLGLFNGCGNGLGGIFGKRNCGENHHLAEMDYIVGNERRIAGIEARQAAMETAVALDREYGRQITDLKIERAVCDKIPGSLFLAPDHIANPYRGSHHQLVSRQVPGCGLGACGGYGGGYGGCGW